MTAQTDPRESLWVRILLVLLAAGALVPIWVAPVPPLQDLPNHLLKVDIFQRWMRGEKWVREIYSLNLRLLANYTLYAAILVLSPLFSLLTAARLFLSMIVVGLPLSAYAFLRRVNPENTLFALAVPAINFNLFLMQGNLNFCLALALYLAALAIFEAESGPAWLHGWGFAATSTALYFTHGFVFLVLAGTVAFLVAVNFRSERLLRACGLLPGLLCLATTFAATLRSGSEATGAFRPYFTVARLHSMRAALIWLLNPHGWGYDTYFALAWLGVVGACGLAALVGAVGRLRDRKDLREVLQENPWLIFAILLIVAYFCAPVQLRDWYHVRARLSPLAVLVLLGALRAPRKQALRASLVVVLVLAALAIEVRNTQEFLKRGRQVQEYLSGTDTVEEGAAMVPVENPEEGPKYRDVLHAWAYYAIARGGWSPYLHAQPSYNPVIYKVTPWGPGEGSPLGAEDTLRRMFACYDYVLLWNPKETDATALRPFFVLVRATPHLGIWRNRTGVRRSTPASNPACALEADTTGDSSHRPMPISACMPPSPFVESVEPIPHP